MTLKQMLKDELNAKGTAKLIGEAVALLVGAVAVLGLLYLPVIMS